MTYAHKSFLGYFGQNWAKIKENKNLVQLSEKNNFSSFGIRTLVLTFLIKRVINKGNIVRSNQFVF
jgi:hypothetical protein